MSADIQRYAIPQGLGAMGRYNWMHEPEASTSSPAYTKVLYRAIGDGHNQMRSTETKGGLQEQVTFLCRFPSKQNPVQCAK